MIVLCENTYFNFHVLFVVFFFLLFFHFFFYIISSALCIVVNDEDCYFALGKTTALDISSFHNGHCSISNVTFCYVYIKCIIFLVNKCVLEYPFNLASLRGTAFLCCIISKGERLHTEYNFLST